MLGISTDTFRVRIRAGHYSNDFTKKGSRSFFSISDIGKLLDQTAILKVIKKRTIN